MIMWNNCTTCIGQHPLMIKRLDTNHQYGNKLLQFLGKSTKHKEIFGDSSLGVARGLTSGIGPIRAGNKL